MRFSIELFYLIKSAVPVPVVVEVNKDLGIFDYELHSFFTSYEATLSTLKQNSECNLLIHFNAVEAQFLIRM